MRQRRTGKTLSIGLAIVGLVASSIPWGGATAGATDKEAPGKEAPGQSGAQGAPSDPLSYPYVPGEVIVAFNPGVGAEQRAEVGRLVGARSAVALSALAPDTEVLTLGAGMGVDQALQALAKAPGVRFVEPNYIYTKAEDSNDPDYTAGNLWGLLGTATTRVNEFGSRAGEAWAGGFVGSRNVVVGIIDEGIEIAHPDLQSNIWQNPGETAGNGIDDDGNGYIDDVNGFDFVSNDSTVFDGSGDDHGTHVAGTIGAQGGNGIGVVGVNWNVSLISAKFLGSSGGSTSNAVRAVDYITSLKVKYGLNVVATSNSWGGGGFSQSLLDAINRGGDQGILFIAAAGNSSSDNDTTANYPSNYDCTKGGTRGFDCVVAVAALASDGNLASFSSYGLSTVDIGAPGVGIKSTVPFSTYASYSGTSMATPHVSGAVALCRAANPTMSAAQTRAALLESIRFTDSVLGKVRNAGRLDVNALLKKCSPPAASMSGVPSALSGSFQDSTSVALQWTDGVSNETGYLVQQAPLQASACGTFTTVGQFGADNTRFLATGLTVGSGYCFRVGATNGSSTQWSSALSVAPPPPPTPYTCSASAYSWIDPLVDATTHTLTDDSATTIALPFAFDFYGSTYTSVQISSNGFLRFGVGPATQFSNVPIPSAADPNAIAAPWWIDFNPGRGGQIRSYVTGASPNRTMVVSWIDILPYSTSATNGASFQVLLDEASRSVTFQYKDAAVGSGTIDGGRTGTVGVENYGGAYGTQILYNAAGLTDSSAIRCTRSNAPVITTTSLPSGVVNEAYSQTIGVSGGTGTKTLSVLGGSLPPGLTLSGSVISGIPESLGTYPFTLQVVDSGGEVGTASLQIVVAEPVGVSSSTLAAATVGSSYSQSLTASGGSAPYTWSVASGSLPAGLTLSSAGVISGTPSSTAKNANFTTQVTDSLGKVATADMQIRVNVAITTSSLPTATQGAAYSQTLVSIGGDPLTSRTWTITSGSLPDGMSLNETTGVISGPASNTAVSTSFTVQVTDGSAEGVAERTLSLTVVTPFFISTASLPGASIGYAYSQTLNVTGGSGSISWSIPTGSLPAGLTLNASTGVISGTPSSTAVSRTFTVRATDSTARTTDKSLTISIVAPTLPANFGKTSPKSAATKVSRFATLYWGTSTRATSYEYCIDTTNNNSCDNDAWVSVGTATSRTVTLSSKITYYWQVRAVNSYGVTVANSGTWWRFTTS